ncbi:MAG: hypothetical protein IPP57_07090 [Candidatus Obscuribacter sp.]|jgi:hypothetical protein|nr:hypothetical protein [Candidatus Obscuribacter sp.]MDQ5966663.1 hypothetical protein [Cyanobacteriota bacterium erpe_2018_sw_39hr_WHONDRS-SW48-000098_B_bin.30]MBK7840469.1 hypothetical protein [Candidatus Obscuribacter sp.]MBK9201666.1 hypothetical protein [Candidatus Obscuribacter sp.]MBK9619963.1 hypothetical protein [Candidatus Obscuribacter sp.]
MSKSSKGKLFFYLELGFLLGLVASTPFLYVKIYPLMTDALAQPFPRKTCVVECQNRIARGQTIHRPDLLEVWIVGEAEPGLVQQKEELIKRVAKRGYLPGDRFKLVEFGIEEGVE